jgi:hypothetical protein
MVKTFFNRRIYYFSQKARAVTGWSLSRIEAINLASINLASINIASTNIAARFIVL